MRHTDGLVIKRWPGPTQSKPLHTIKGDNVPTVYIGNWLGKAVWAILSLGKGNLICGIASLPGSGCTWWVMWKDEEVQCVPQGDLMPGENNP